MNGFDPDYNRQHTATKSTPTAVASVDHDPLLVLKSRLDAGEHILWSGKPLSNKIFRLAFAIYFFAIPWTAFALFWESMALGVLFSVLQKAERNTPLIVGIIFPLFGLPFIAIGFWMMSQPFTLRRKARNTVYALTNKRAIIFINDKEQELRGYPLTSLVERPDMREFPDGSGSMIFLPEPLDRQKGGVISRLRGFEYLANAKEAEQAFVRARRGLINPSEAEQNA